MFWKCSLAGLKMRPIESFFRLHVDLRPSCPDFGKDGERPTGTHSFARPMGCQHLFSEGCREGCSINTFLT
jgi:hypothetical protein